MDPGQSSDVQPSASEESGTVEIKIKTLDAQSYSLRVDKNTPVPALKDQIASVVGVPVENQRLICRGKVLKDDQVLSSYNVEDGHTLHLVARQPHPPSPPSSGQEHMPGASGPSDMMLVSPRTRPHMSHSVLMGTINIPDTAEGGMPDLNRIISAVLGSVGIGNPVTGGTHAGNGSSVAVGVLPSRPQAGAGTDGQPRAEGSDPRPPGVPPPGDQNDSIDDIEAQLQLDAIYGVHPPGIFAGTGATGLPPHPFHLMQTPLVVPDALTTMSQYMDRLEQSFSLIESRRRQTTQGPNASQGVTHVNASNESRQGSEARTGQGLGATPSSSASPGNRAPSNSGTPGSGGGPTGTVASSRRLPTPSALGAIVNRVQNLLNGHAGSALSRLAAQLENEPTLVDAAEREEMQRTALRDGNLIQQLGALFLELGRTTMTLRLGQSPAESVVNAGPAVFISPSGPNPMMVQSLPLQGGVALGTVPSVPSGTSQGNGGHVGPSLGPRSINIHIRTSDLRLPSPSPSAAPSPQQPPAQTVIGVTSQAPQLNVRDIMDRGDSASPEHGLTVRQIIERAEAATGAQPGHSEPNAPAAPGGAVQGAIMTFNENGAMRVVPVRTRPATVPLSSNPHTVSEGEALFQPLIARFQHLGGAQHGRAVGTPRSTSIPASNHPVGGGAGEHPPPSVRAQVHIQAWAPSVMQATSGASSQLGSSQPVSGGAPANVAAPVSGLGSGGTQNVQRDSSMAAPNSRAAEGHGSGHPGDSHLSNPPADGVVQSLDVSQIVDSLGPFLNQIALAFQRPQAPDQRPPSQANEQLGMRNPDPETLNAGAPAGPQSADGPNGFSLSGDGTNVPAPPEQPREGQDQKSYEMDAPTGNESTPETQHNPGNSSTIHVPRSENVVDGGAQREQMAVDSQSQVENRPATPFGLGLGGLQPRPTRSRRRPTPTSRQVQPEDVGAPASAGNGVTNGPREQNVTAVAGQNLLETLMQRSDRASNRNQDDLSEESLGQFTQSLLPLLSQAMSQGRAARGGEVPRGLGEVMGQLAPRTAEGGAGQGAAMGDMLRGMMGQIAQSPLMENIAQQVITNVHNDETQNGETSLLGRSDRSQGDMRNLDFGSIVQQMLPVVSQMFGGRPTPSAGQQVPNSASVRSHHADGAARSSPGFISDSGRWREALSEEEATSWSETMTADVQRQQTMEPQRPFSEVYVRGSPLAKRQKTDMEGATGQKLENGVPPESVLSVPEVGIPPHAAGEGTISTSDEGLPQGQQAGAVGEGMTDAHMAVLFHDLAARVAADPDFVDDSGLPNATGVFEQQKASQEPAGG